MSPRLEFAQLAATTVGAGIRRHFENRVRYSLKEDKSPVTIADQEAESSLRLMIEREFPGDSILGEEEGGDPNLQTGWMLDPIDGTKSFVCGVPLYATLIAYCEEGVPQIGVCFLPSLDTMVVAERGKGAFENGKRISVSKQESLIGAVLSCGSPNSMIRSGRLPGLLHLSADAMATRTWCDAYGHFLVASGRIDAMIDPIVQPWDIAAMSIIVEEAGGECTSFDGAKHPRSEAISSNGLLQRDLIEVFADCE